MDDGARTRHVRLAPQDGSGGSLEQKRSREIGRRLRIGGAARPMKISTRFLFAFIVCFSTLGLAAVFYACRVAVASHGWRGLVNVGATLLVITVAAGAAML